MLVKTNDENIVFFKLKILFIIYYLLYIITMYLKFVNKLINLWSKSM
jgi:hypothetical protein